MVVTSKLTRILTVFSPILAITQHGPEEYVDGSIVFVCFTLVEDLLPCAFFIGSIVVFFIFPLAILICIYALIAKSLMAHPTMAVSTRSNALPSQSVAKYRKQVILMLGTVVAAFFICLLPFRALTLWIIVAPAGSSYEIGFENYYNILYFSRIMFHINSAVNPILYNVMSSKFRGGFFKLCGLKSIRKRYRRKPEMTRKSTTSSSAHTTSQQTSDSNLKGSRSHSRYSTSLKEVKEIPSECECSTSANQSNLAKNAYIRAPLHIAHGICGQKLPNGEIFV
ncbi:growth hormone secretagogue receptor type 1-like [Anoplophora glabripennis]|uniref:growth hormone secretagogue receptor type 1-like n=1 Tax=Anoplophora glabripennis TaxID=217634 RepID=UPI000C75BDFE|nr:growth hormone secretagogue receptor type 1-like [Anoplophora glabripennis]